MRLSSSPRLLGALAVAVVAALTGLDLVVDSESFEFGDFLVDLGERALLVGGMVLIALMASDMRRVRAEQAEMRVDVGRAVAAGEAWRDLSRTHIEGLSAAIAQEFDAWGLTPAEAEIAGLMLKGMSLREIAAARSTGETTIRQQAASVYRKSGVSGRVELAAYFLDSLAPIPAQKAAQ